MTPYRRVEQREKRNSVMLAFLSSTGCVPFVAPEENGWSGTLKEKESWWSHEDCADWLSVNLTQARIIRRNELQLRKHLHLL